MQQRTGDQQLVKEINTSIVLETVMRKQPVSRAGISELTGLNKGTVSSLVQLLMDRQLVFETGAGQSSGGRRPVMLEFNSYAGYAIGIDLGVRDMLLVAVDLHGGIVLERRSPVRANDFAGVCAAIGAAVRAAVAELPPSPYGVTGIGIGVPGMVDESGEVLFAPNLQWTNVPLLAELQTMLPEYPLFIDNEANAGAIGEKQFGGGQQAANLLYISVGTGIGAGVIIGNKLYKGTSGVSGETGHMSIYADGKLCKCGNRGCWELYASEQALLDLLEPAPGCPAPSLDDIVALARGGDERAAAALRECGRHLGVGIASLINIFNPDQVIIGNRVTIAQPWLAGAVAGTVGGRTLSYHLGRAKVSFSRLNAYSTALGAAYTAIASFIRRSAAVDGLSSAR